MKQNILIRYFQWHFAKMPKEILRIWKNYFRYYSYLFSIPLLLQTLFAPWRKYAWSYGRGFSIQRWAEAFISNSFSRLIGAIMRSFLIITGLLMEFFVFIFGLVFFIVWIFAPILIVICFFVGIKLLF